MALFPCKLLPVHTVHLGVGRNLKGFEKDAVWLVSGQGVVNWVGSEGRLLYVPGKCFGLGF